MDDKPQNCVLLHSAQQFLPYCITIVLCVEKGEMFLEFLQSTIHYPLSTWFGRMLRGYVRTEKEHSPHGARNISARSREVVPTEGTACLDRGNWLFGLRKLPVWIVESSCFLGRKEPVCGSKVCCLRVESMLFTGRKEHVCRLKVCCFLTAERLFAATIH